MQNKIKNFPPWIPGLIGALGFSDDLSKQAADLKLIEGLHDGSSFAFIYFQLGTQNE